jgi:hypothetical protein
MRGKDVQTGRENPCNRQVSVPFLAGFGMSAGRNHHRAKRLLREHPNATTLTEAYENVPVQINLTDPSLPAKEI